MSSTTHTTQHIPHTHTSLPSITTWCIKTHKSKAEASSNIKFKTSLVGRTLHKAASSITACSHVHVQQEPQLRRARKRRRQAQGLCASAWQARWGRVQTSCPRFLWTRCPSGQPSSPSGLARGFRASKAVATAPQQATMLPALLGTACLLAPFASAAVVAVAVAGGAKLCVEEGWARAAMALAWRVSALLLLLAAGRALRAR